MSAHLDIKLTIVDLLKGAGVAGGRVYPSRTRAIGAEQPDGVVVRNSRSASELAAVLGGRTNWTSLIEIDCYARNTGGVPDAAADAIVVAVFESMAESPTLGGKALDVEPLEDDTLDWYVDALDSNLACITAKFIVKHQTIGRKLTA